MSGSVISSSVGSVGLWAYKAKILHSPSSVCAVFVIAGTEAYLGVIAISEPLYESYLTIAMFRVKTIFEVCRTRYFIFEIYFVLKYGPSPTKLWYLVVILCYCLCVLLPIQTQGIIYLDA
jgi:hypothetical protein